MTQTRQKSIARLIAEICAGVQVPMSMGALGAAREPCIELRHRLGLHGYPSADEIEPKVKQALADELAAKL